MFYDYFFTQFLYGPYVRETDFRRDLNDSTENDTTIFHLV
jgi:hypothetical protein